MRGVVVIVAFLAAAFFLAAPVAVPFSGDENPNVAAAREGGIRFDSTVTLGNLLTAAMFVSGLIAAYAGFKARLAVIEVKLDTLWRAWIRNHRKEETQ